MKQYIVDAFTSQPFAGNPAAVCVMDCWLSEESMMKLAMENNLSETAFIVKEEEGSGASRQAEAHTAPLPLSRSFRYTGFLKSKYL